MIKKDWTKRNYQYRLLVFGIMMTLCGIYDFQNSMAFKPQLKEIKGTLRTADTYVEKSARNSSKKSELIFYLNEYKKKFYLLRNIGSDYQDKRYEKIMVQLRSADSISVWIRARDLDEYEPRVFQITANEKVILDFSDATRERIFVTILLLVLGIGSILYFLYVRFRQNGKK